MAVHFLYHVSMWVVGKLCEAAVRGNGAKHCTTVLLMFCDVSGDLMNMQYCVNGLPA